MASSVESPVFEVLPPGTQQIKDIDKAMVVLSPTPSADPNQPLNWPTWRKVLHMTILCFYTIFVFAVLTVATPLWAAINLETGVSYDDLNNAYASSSGALAIGCIFFVPPALRFGRRPVYIATSTLMTASAIWQARAQTTGDFIGSNIVAGLAGAVNEALLQVTVSDLFFVHQRASANGLYLTAVCVGNYLGPVAAGYVADSQGWRWTFYYLTIFMSITTLAIIFGLEESKFTSPIVVGQTATTASVTTTNPTSERSIGKRDMSSESSPVKGHSTTQFTTVTTHNSNIFDNTIPVDSYLKRHRLYTINPPSLTSTSSTNNFLLHLIQPFQLLITFPAIAFTALQYGWLVSLLSIVAITQATLLPTSPYNFPPSAVGLMSLPPAIGAILGSLLGGPLVDHFSVFVAKRPSRGGIHEPETRLWLFLVPGILGMVGGSLIYGLTISTGQHWIANAIGAGLVGFALGDCGDMALTYLQDSYVDILGDALVGVVFVRNAISTIMIFAIPPWMNGMGGMGMFAMIGVISLVVCMTCVPMIVWGRMWRAKLAGRYGEFARKQY